MSVRIINADVMDGLAQLESESVHCVVTSPPYFGLRDYGTAQWDGGDPDCDHVERTAADVHKSSTLGPKRDGLKPDNAAFKSLARQFANECGKCGATRIDKQIGLEPTPDAYVSKLVEVFREVRRVLRKDGTCWLNLGDSYAGGAGGRGDVGREILRGDGTAGETSRKHDGQRIKIPSPGLKPKDLIGVPWRVAFALQADGWWLRQDIIWSKPNPMPESVTDRCTKSHEYIFMLTKSARYYFDAEAIKEEGSIPAGTLGAKGSADRAALNGVNVRPPEYKLYDGFRNRRSVWEVTTQPFPEAHFATFPPALIEPCIKAGCPEGGTVLDPFGGSGTTGLVADRLKRNAILIELNPEYAAMAERRIKGDCPMFAEVGA